MIDRVTERERLEQLKEHLRAAGDQGPPTALQFIQVSSGAIVNASFYGSE